MNASAHFPRVAGKSLDGTHFELPRGFAGAINIVIVAFRQEQQRDVNTWMPWLKMLVRGHDSVRIYELPTISRGFAMMRGFITSGMRHDAADQTARARTITLFVDKRSFRDALGLPDEECIYVLLVDRRGRIYDCQEGRFTPEAADAIEHHLTAITQRFQTTVSVSTNGR
ncbi:MAG TPA: hypothetical protein VN706_14135 [Gemmatimonadaceae bacterium]|nr:hypothetical protein [Gemmatimonadaceae bacterium]